MALSVSSADTHPMNPEHSGKMLTADDISIFVTIIRNTIKLAFRGKHLRIVYILELKSAVSVTGLTVTTIQSK